MSFLPKLTKLLKKDVGMAANGCLPPTQTIILVNLNLQASAKTKTLPLSPSLLANISDILLLLELTIFEFNTSQ